MFTSISMISLQWSTGQLLFDLSTATFLPDKPNFRPILTSKPKFWRLFYLKAEKCQLGQPNIKLLTNSDSEKPNFRPILTYFREILTIIFLKSWKMSTWTTKYQIFDQFRPLNRNFDDYLTQKLKKLDLENQISNFWLLSTLKNQIIDLKTKLWH